jgi:chloramphenicol 3-O phosphotransferase
MMTAYGTIVILNGASSSGKTSILRALQAMLPEPYLDAGIDKFIWMLPKRYLDRPLWDDILGLAIQPGETGRRLFTGMHRAIAALARSGNNVLADHVLVEPAWVSECASLFYDLPAYLVGIRCPLAVLEERERTRKDRTLGQAGAQYLLVHAHCIYDLEVDTSLLNVAECALRIKELLDDAKRPAAFRQLAGLPAG